MANQFFYVSSYTEPRGEPARGGAGISLCRFDNETGEMVHLEDGPELLNPTYFAFDHGKHHLFAVRACPKAQRPGVSSMRYDPENGGLQSIDFAEVEGEGPCHVALDPAGGLVVLANYRSGSVSLVEVGDDGRFGASRTLQHEGKGPNRARQEGPHAHCIHFTGPGRFLATDLGTDAIIAYDCSPGIDGVIRVDPPIRAKPGAGPRHLTAISDGKTLFCLNELDSTLYAIRDGEIVAEAGTLPNGFSGSSTCAAVHLSRDDRFVYATNRGHDSLAIFAWHDDEARLESIGHHPSFGAHPRDFTLSLENDWLIAANQDTHNLFSFRRNHETGRLSDPVGTLELGAPVCVKFIPS